jgi:pimeloyl-ACP methyl ester carboxylesterase
MKVYSYAASRTAQTGWPAFQTGSPPEDYVYAVSDLSAVLAVTPNVTTPPATSHDFEIRTWNPSTPNLGGSLTFALSYSPNELGSACWLLYYPSSNQAYLFADDGVHFTVNSPQPFGNGGQLQNSQCTINTASSTAPSAGNGQIIKIAVSFWAPFMGTNYIYVNSAAENGGNAGLVPMGSWMAYTPISALPPPQGTVTSPGHEGMGDTFTFLATDLNGYPYLTWLSSSFTADLNGGLSSRCNVWFRWVSNWLVLISDTGQWTGAAIGDTVGQPLENSNCFVAQSLNQPPTGTGNTLALKLKVDFKSGFLGEKKIYSYVADRGGDTGWPQVGTYTVSSPISVSVSPQTGQLDGGEHLQFTPTVTGTANQSVIWSVSAGSITQAGLYTAPTDAALGKTVTVIATSAADLTKSASATVSLKVDFSVNPTAALSVVAGGASSSSVFGITRIHGFTAPVTLNWTNKGFWPAGLTANLNNGNSIDVFAGPSTPGGDNTLTFSVTGGGITQTGNVRVTVVAKLSVWISADPNPMISGHTVALTAHPVGGLPPYTYNWGAGPAGQTITTTLYDGGLGHSEIQSVNITDSSAQAANWQLVVPMTSLPDFSMSTTAVTIAAGQASTVNETITPLNGFNGMVTFSWFNPAWPTGLTANFVSANPASGGISITFNAASYTPAGTYQFTLGGTSGTLVHGVAASVTVTRTVDFSVIATPASQTVGQGGSATSTISVNGAYNGIVSLAAARLPSGVAYTFNPASLNGSGATALTITTDSSTPIGTYGILISATAGSIVRSTVLNLEVAPISPAEMKKPGLGTYFGPGSVVPFQWKSGVGVSQLRLSLGSTQGASDYGTAPYGAATPGSLVDAPITLPGTVQSQALWVTLSSQIAGNWQNRYYQYKTGSAPPPAIQTPTSSRQAASSVPDMPNDNTPQRFLYCIQDCDALFDAARIVDCAVSETNSGVSARLTAVGAQLNPAKPKDYFEVEFTADRSATIGTRGITCRFQSLATPGAIVPISVSSAVNIWDASPNITAINQLPPDPGSTDGSFWVEIYGYNFGLTRGTLSVCLHDPNLSNPCTITQELQAVVNAPPYGGWSDGQINALIIPSPNPTGPYDLQVTVKGFSGTPFAQVPGQPKGANDRKGTVQVDSTPVIEPSVYYQEPLGVQPMSKTMTIKGKRLMSSAPGAPPPNISDSRGYFNFQIDSTAANTSEQITVKYTLDRGALPSTNSVKVTRVPGGTGSKDVSVLPRTYVILVHGINQSGAAMQPLGDNLRRQFAQTPAITIDNGFSLGPRVGAQAGISSSAQALASYINAALQVTSGSRIVLVGYSMGGLLSRQLIVDSFFNSQYNPPSPLILGLVTLGTPNLGYPYLDSVEGIAPFVLFSPAQLRDMSGDFRRFQSQTPPDVDLSSALSSLKTQWAGYNTVATPWLAASGRSCDNPLRLLGPSIGCRDGQYKYSDGVVCEDSAAWLLPQFPGQPFDRWVDTNRFFQHTDSTLVTPWGNAGVFCPGQQYLPVLFNPLVGFGLLERITLFIGSL